MLQESASGAVEASVDHATPTRRLGLIRARLRRKCVPELVSAQAAANPRALAVRHGFA